MIEQRAFTYMEVRASEHYPHVEKKVAYCRFNQLHINGRFLISSPFQSAAS